MNLKNKNKALSLMLAMVMLLGSFSTLITVNAEGTAYPIPELKVVMDETTGLNTYSIALPNDTPLPVGAILQYKIGEEGTWTDNEA